MCMRVDGRDNNYHRHVLSTPKTLKEPMNTKTQYLITHIYSFNPVIIGVTRKRERRGKQRRKENIMRVRPQRTLVFSRE